MGEFDLLIQFHIEFRDSQRDPKTMYEKFYNGSQPCG